MIVAHLRAADATASAPLQGVRTSCGAQLGTVSTPTFTEQQGRITEQLPRGLVLWPGTSAATVSLAASPARTTGSGRRVHRVGRQGPISSRLWRFPGRAAGLPWNQAFAEPVEQVRVRRQQSFAGVNPRLGHDRCRTAASEDRELVQTT